MSAVCLLGSYVSNSGEDYRTAGPALLSNFFNDFLAVRLVTNMECRYLYLLYIRVSCIVCPCSQASDGRSQSTTQTSMIIVLPAIFLLVLWYFLLFVRILQDSERDLVGVG